MKIKTMGFYLLNLILLIFSAFLVTWVHPNEFIQAHMITFFLVLMSFFINFFIHQMKLLEDNYVVTVPCLLYFLLMDVFMLLHLQVEEQVLFGLWCVVIGSAGISYQTYHMMKPKTAATTTQAYKEEDLVWFHHTDFDYVLENLRIALPYLQQHQAVIGVEKVYQAEQVLLDLEKTVVHYKELQVTQREEAEQHIENLCVYAEALFDELKAKSDARHLHDIKKYAMKHVKTQN